MAYHSGIQPAPFKAVQSNAALNLFPSNKMNPKTGYGKMELGLLRGLLQAGAQVAITDQRNRPQHPVTLVIGSPEWCDKVPGRKWCYTMSESNRVSDEWVELMNRHCERVLVPCPELVKIYEASGVLAPVDYVPLGVDWRPPQYVERNPHPLTPSPLHREGEFRWLTYSLGDMRKGADLAIFAFNRVFGGDKRYKLIIKCRDNPQWLTGLQDEQIEVERGETSDEAYHDLLARCHGMIFASRGEGFGLPPREAVLSGMPVIATGALGMWDVDGWGWKIPVRGMRPAQFDFWEANAEGAQWWEPDNAAIDAQLLAISRDYPAALERAFRGRQYLMNNFTWEKTAGRIIELLQS